jgi:hypothetical protein
MNGTNSLGYGGFTVGTLDFGNLLGITIWRLAPISNGSSSQAIAYANGSVLNGDGNYYLYPNLICFLEGTKILASVDGKETYVPVEQLRKGSLVKTSSNGYKKVENIGYSTLNNPGTSERIQDRLYKLTKANYPKLTEDLFITGCHSILVDSLTQEQQDETKKQFSRIFITDKKYRLAACIDEKAEPWASEGVYTIWHFSLESEDDGINYGVYANGNLLVESCSIRSMKSKSNMTFIN